MHWRNSPAISIHNPSPLRSSNLTSYAYMDNKRQNAYGYTGAENLVPSMPWKLLKRGRNGRRRSSLQLYVASLSSMSSMTESHLVSFCAVRGLDVKETKKEIRRQEAANRADSVTRRPPKGSTFPLRRNSLSMSIPAERSSSSLSPSPSFQQEGRSCSACTNSPTDELDSDDVLRGQGGSLRLPHPDCLDRGASARRAHSSDILQAKIQDGAAGDVSYPWLPRRYAPRRQSSSSLSSQTLSHSMSSSHSTSSSRRSSISPSPSQEAVHPGRQKGQNTRRASVRRLAPLDLQKRSATVDSSVSKST